MGIDPRKRRKLVDLFGEVRVKAIERRLDDHAEAAKASGVDYKERRRLAWFDDTDAVVDTAVKVLKALEDDGSSSAIDRMASWAFAGKRPR